MIPKPKELCGNCPLYLPPYGKTVGFSYPDGDGTSGVCVIAEALGESEEISGRPLIGKSGFSLFQQLSRIGITRDSLTLLNVIFCRPPNNHLIKQPYEQEAISNCSPILDRAIEGARIKAIEHNKTFVIVCLGLTSFKRVLGLDYKRDHELLKRDNYAYPFWSDRYQAWAYHCPHPAYLLRGQTHLWPIVQFTFKRALEVADGGLRLDEHDYLLDPDPAVFDGWIAGYIQSLVNDPSNPLSYDIETPYKKKTKDEGELGKEEDADHTILRISFSYWAHDRTHTVSVKWSAEFLAGIERLFKVAGYVLGWNSTNYDSPRVSRHLTIHGIDLDAMVAWHILNTSLPKSLGFVAPFYVQTTGMWKHLSEAEPAFYNAKDADMALRIFRGVKADLIKNRLWDVFERHVIKINEILKYMTGIGVRLDLIERQNAEDKLQGLLDGIEAAMEEAVPIEARKFKVWKKVPKTITDDMVLQVHEIDVTYCGTCGFEKPKLKWHKELCAGQTMIVKEPRSFWASPLEFKVSKVGLSNYQKALKHQAIFDRKEHKVTYNADAITLLVKKYKNDKLYPRILEHRKVQRLLSTYVGYTDHATGKIIGGMPADKWGFIHAQYTHNPSTLRFACEEPNLQNLPRPNPTEPDDLFNIVRNLIVSGEGNILYARDYSGIEAVLTGYFALDPKYIRLARRDIHSYYTVYALYELEGGARIKSSDLPDIDWPDDRLFPYLEELKGRFKWERNQLYKHLVHAANFMQGAKGAQAKIFSETGIEHPVETVKKVMDVYYALFPKIKQWHKNVLNEAEKDGYLRNPWGYVHRFSKVYDYKKEFGDWIKTPGPDSNRAIAFKPQSTAAAIIKQAMIRLYFERFEEAGRFLRLQVHDELFSEVPLDKLDEVDRVSKEVMEMYHPEMAMPESWGMGTHLNILTEAKAGDKWGGMSEKRLNDLLNRKS